MDKGFFISFEGIDGSGKTTQIKLLAKNLRKIGIEPVLTKEPGGTPIGEKIRTLLLDNKNKEMLPQTEVYLYAASRSEFVRKVVAPALKEKKILITDRYVDSNLAYQGAGGIPIREIQKINSLAVEGILPDIVFLLDTSPEECQKRMSKRKGKDRIESKGEGYQVKISKNYHKLAEKNKNFVVIPQQKSITKTADLIFRKVKERAGI